jgi:hypothetical protein
MKRSVLFIADPKDRFNMVSTGYCDALRQLGWKTYLNYANTKNDLITLIKEHNVRLIFTTCKYGTRQLPIDIINQYDVGVVVQALPHNNTDSYLYDFYRRSTDHEIRDLLKINKLLVHTNLVQDVWPKYMEAWLSSNISLIHLPLAGNILRSLPINCKPVCHTCMVGSFAHKQERFDDYLIPLFHRLSFLKTSNNIWGDKAWHDRNIMTNGPLFNGHSQLPNIYAQSHVSLNIHTKTEYEDQTCLNERSFAIQLCGGTQVTDMSIAKRYFDNFVHIGPTTNKFIVAVENNLTTQNRCDNILASVQHAANNHTYHCRLANIFQVLGWNEDMNLCQIEADRLATLHVWEFEARLDAERNGVLYESPLKQIA